MTRDPSIHAIFGRGVSYDVLGKGTTNRLAIENFNRTLAKRISTFSIFFHSLEGHLSVCEGEVPSQKVLTISNGLFLVFPVKELTHQPYKRSMR